MASKKTSPTAKSRTQNTTASPASPRVKRPELGRTEPIRSWSTMFGADSGVTRGQAAYANGARTASDAVKRGVELGYRVVDEYVRQGSAAAEAFSGRGRRPGVTQEQMPQMAERLMRSAQDFSSLWFDMMGTLMANMPGPAGNGEHRPPEPRSNAWSHPHAKHSNGDGNSARQRRRVVVRIDSQRPTEVTVSLDAVASEVMVEPLRAGAKGAPIEALLQVLDHDAEEVRVTVHVPPEIPADRYTGAILDAASGTSVGRLTITVLD